MDAIVMSSKVLVVTQINRKTKAQMFQNLKLGSKIQLSIPVKRAGTGRGTYASYICTENVDTSETNYSSFNQLPALLSAFEFEELN
ncbi:hypothetical protein [Paenibacillus agilis]|uniref:Uncharacterized protein n=1 Tax=Paenibacillus agilis TaxID=3020863 RepID=A0A559IEY0_9BACL|nr:hypothetical protein [Paenibacillus agilis]TVX86023.1 hypothetical protein FPZ44_24055 [Paenibacillus agilis]